ncbi:putative Transcriptional Regulator, Crp family protein [Vibrio nigripulchritudo SO65]|uniref:Crp/Fnr family transcriptional regulator n=1 Tax=Vibrio nigripulchritudo TaxID=28173 RepID=UPI0003B23066|nr:Crp/Fnr family transcriptional regulator [Vibrio nigripulchritudo]CCN36406.1 putative Transcriptional Regulator, Crp family protein [Vibrio nigripulchritudo AM115]CCN40697.1 putative Transcriptional Regulator, Crp family protein [Vibrio nigripulchritudo FTn2]CCN64496.1 putative Transcriptional Regulator, Crp family protein [Vibrio nigripulchritudo POn4]CCN77397.1 putative Transcriptional Regulator, Crp family protein [Vibrio nigripulchritudo SO65]
MPDTILSLLDSEKKSDLLNCRKEKTYSAGAVLFERGDQAKHMFRVEKGKVSLFRLMPNGDEKLFKVFMSGGWIAEMAMFMNPRQYPMSARVDQDTTLSLFHHKDVARVFTSEPEISLKTMHFMSNKIHELMNTVDILTQVSAPQRLIMKLAEVYRKEAAKYEGKIPLPASKKLMATQLGMTPETLSRTLTKLKDEGYIRETGHWIKIEDIPTLCEHVDLSPDIFSISSELSEKSGA